MPPERTGTSNVFTAHVRLSRQAGVSESIIDAVKRGDLPSDTPADEAMVMRFRP